MKILSERLKQARLEKGMTQKDLFKKTGLAMSSICLYETGKTEPSLFSTFLLADALGVSIDWLVGRRKAKK